MFPWIGRKARVEEEIIAAARNFWQVKGRAIFRAPGLLLTSDDPLLGWYVGLGSGCGSTYWAPVAAE